MARTEGLILIVGGPSSGLEFTGTGPNRGGPWRIVEHHSKQKPSHVMFTLNKHPLCTPSYTRIVQVFLNILYLLLLI